VERAGIGEDREGPLFRPLSPDGLSLVRRHLDRKTPWRLVKKYCQAAGIDPNRLGQRGIGIHSLRKTAINDVIRNGAQMHEVRAFAAHSDIRTTELYFVRKEEDGEVAARRIQIRVPGRGGGGAQGQGYGLVGDPDAVEAKSGIGRQEREQLQGAPWDRGRRRKGYPILRTPFTKSAGEPLFDRR
jgi:hypothetical protein